MRRAISVLFLSSHTTTLLEGSGYFSQVPMPERRMISSLSTELFWGTLSRSVTTYDAFFFIKEFTWAVLVGIREHRFVRVPVYSQMYEFSLAAGKAVAYLSKRGEPLQQDDKRASKQTESRNESLLNYARHCILQPVLKGATRDLAKYLTEQACNL